MLPRPPLRVLTGTPRAPATGRGAARVDRHAMSTMRSELSPGLCGRGASVPRRGVRLILAACDVVGGFARGHFMRADAAGLLEVAFDPARQIKLDPDMSG